MALRPSSAVPAPAVLPPVLLARDHLGSTVAAEVRAGRWQRVGVGAYVPTGSVPTRGERALARIAAVHQRLPGSHWFSHESAALVWGLPVWRVPEVTHLRQTGRPGSTRDRALRRHTGPVPPGHLIEAAGLPVTSIELTAVDCARTCGPLEALVVADAALRAGGRRELMLELLAPLAGRRGVIRARAVLEHADPGAESAQETATRHLLLVAGLPVPVTQLQVATRLGTFWADLGLPDAGLLLEYDGRVKYQEPQAWLHEKRRHDALVEAGWTVLRVTKEDLRQPQDLVARVRRHLPRGTPIEPRRALRAAPPVPSRAACPVRG